MEITSNGSTYFHEYNDFNKIKFCYSTKIINPYITYQHLDKYVLITYWTEISNKANTYSHKCILFYPLSNSFSNELSLSSGSIFVVNKYYPEKCITFRDTDIFCGIHFSPEGNDIHILGNNYIIETKKIFLDAIEHKDSSVYLVVEDSLISLRNFHRPIGIGKSGQNPLIGKYDVYMTEMHEYRGGKEVTLLLYSNYKKIIGKDKITIKGTTTTIEIVVRASFIPYFLNLYLGLNIENNYVNPNLFNYLENNDDLIIIYISQEAKMSLLLTRFNVNDPGTKKIYAGFKNVARNTFIQTDICQEPKYLHSIYINSFINYDSQDKEYMNKNKNKEYYKYKKDIGVLISCLENDNIIYQTRKIELPQCLNTLDEINGMNLHKLEFRGEKKEFIFDIYNDPNLFSWRNVFIKFNYSEIFNFLYSMQVKIEGETNFRDMSFNLDYKNVIQIKINRKYNLTTKEPIKIQYRTTQNLINKKDMASQLISDVCYLSINSFNGEECSINSCLICKNNYFCEKCKASNGIYKDEIENSLTFGKCICNEENGFKIFPKKDIEQCVCKDNYSYYKNIYQCKSNEELENGPFYINQTDEKSGIDIYDDCYETCKKCSIGGFSIEKQNCDECKDGYIFIDNNCINDDTDITSGSATTGQTDKTSEIDTTNDPIDIGECGDYCCLSNKKEWFKLEKHIFYYVKINKCILIYYENEVFFVANKYECLDILNLNNITLDNISECLNNSEIKDNESYKNFINSAQEYNYNDKNISIYKNIEEENKFFCLYKPLITYKSNNLSDIYFEGDEINDIVIFKVDIKRNDTITRQVEYQFYNSSPDSIYNIINITEHISNKSQRRLENNDNIYIYLDLPIDWKKGQLEKLKELENKNINPLNTSSEFYNDVCNKYTTPNKNNIYLEDRKEEYYQDELYCENNCEFIFEKFKTSTGKITCKCKIKTKIYNSDEISFKHNNKDNKFKKTILAPNIQAIKCLPLAIKKNIISNIGFYITTFLFLIFLGLFIYKCCILEKEFKNIKQTLKAYLDSKKGEGVLGANVIESYNNPEPKSRHKRTLKNGDYKRTISEKVRLNNNENSNSDRNRINTSLIKIKNEEEEIKEENNKKGNYNTINVFKRENSKGEEERNKYLEKSQNNGNNNNINNSINNNKVLISEEEDKNDKISLTLNKKPKISSTLNKYNDTEIISINDADPKKENYDIDDNQSNNIFDKESANFTKALIKSSLKFDEKSENKENKENKIIESSLISKSSEIKTEKKNKNEEGIDSFNINPSIEIINNDNSFINNSLIKKEENINIQQSNNFFVKKNGLKESEVIKSRHIKKNNIAAPPKKNESNEKEKKETYVTTITWFDISMNISVVILCISFGMFLNLLLIFNKSVVQLYTKDFNFGIFLLNNISSIGIILLLLFVKWYISINYLLVEIHVEGKIEKQDYLSNLEDKIENNVPKLKKKIIGYGIIGIIFHIFNFFIFNSYCKIYPIFSIKLLINIAVSIFISLVIILIFCLIRVILKKIFGKDFIILNRIYQYLNIFDNEIKIY